LGNIVGFMTQDLIGIIWSLSQFPVSVILWLYLYNLNIIFVCYWCMATNAALRKILARVIQKCWWRISQTLYSQLREINWICTYWECKIILADYLIYLVRKARISQSLFLNPTLVQQYTLASQKFPLVPWHILKHIIITASVLQYQPSGIQFAPKANRNALLGSNTLLTLMLLCLHSTSCQTLMQAPSDWNTFCGCNSLYVAYPLNINLFSQYFISLQCYKVCQL